MKRTSRERITRVLARGPQRGLDAWTIANRAGTTLGTTRTILSGLRAEGIVQVAGVRSFGLQMGRPSNLYVLAA